MKPNETRLVIEFDKNLHHDIKRRAVEQRMTMKAWIILAVSKLMQEEDSSKENNEEI